MIKEQNKTKDKNIDSDEINVCEEKKIYKISEAEESELPLVSVIMPVYNAEKYLKNSLHSLLNQTYKKIEIICVNDGSTDNSLKILEHIAESDDRIIIIDQKNSGPAHARNVALDRAKGKYISFVDADDSTDMWMYYSLVEYAENEDADIIVFGGTPFPNEEAAPGWIREKLSPRYIVYDNDNAGREALFRENSSKPFIWLHFIKHSIIEQAPVLRMNETMDLGEDQLFQFMYFPRAKKVIFWDKKFYFYRWYNEGSLMWTYNNKRVTKFKKHIGIVENVFKSWNEAGYKDPYGELVSWMVSFIYYDLISFPLYLQHEFAKSLISLTEKYDQPIFMCNEYEMTHALEIQKLAKEDISYDEVINMTYLDMNSKIQDIEDDISARLNSKAFKLGVMLTPKKKRLNIEEVLPPIEKRN